jgi:di/tricarboxylate transporter
MTLDQALAFGLIGTTIGLFVWGRLPYDLVALLSLLAGVVIGIVPAKKAFEGFADDVVIIVATALLVSSAVARSGAVETMMRPLLRRLRGTAAQVSALSGMVLVLSAFTKNIGALAIFMPVAFQLGRRTGTSPSSLLMPMAFASLIGGLVTLIGTSPNIIVSRLRQDITGEPFAMFDFAPVGLGIAAAGWVFLSLGWRLLPQDRRGAVSMDAALNIEGYTTEAVLPPDSPMVGRTVAELEAVGEGGVAVATVVRERFRRYTPGPDWELRPDDVLLLRGEAEDLDRVVARAGLRLAGEQAKRPAGPAGGGEDGEDSVVEGVVTADSPLIGRTPAQMDLHRRFAVSLLAVSRSGQPVSQRLNAVRLRAGDVALFKGGSGALPGALAELRGAALVAARHRPRPQPPRPLAGPGARRGHDPAGSEPGAGGGGLLRRRGAAAAAARHDDAGSLRHGGVVRADPARAPSSPSATPSAPRGHGPDRRLAVRRGGGAAANGVRGDDHGGGDGGHALPEQRGHRADAGAHRRQPWRSSSD